MWNPDGKVLATNHLGSLEPSEVLVAYDGEALTYTFISPDRELYLLHNLCLTDTATRYLVSAIDQSILNDLKKGKIDTFTALKQPRCWVVDFSGENQISNLWRVDFSNLPTDFLPKPGSLLDPSLEPFFRLRLIGPGVGPGKTTAGDIRTAAQAAEYGLRGLARIVLDIKKKSGKVHNEVQYFSDLPFQTTRAASFELVFGKPQGRIEEFDDEVFEEMTHMLEKGIKSIRSNDAPFHIIDGLDIQQTIDLFDALKSLTPPARGDIDQIEIGGVLTNKIKEIKLLTKEDRIRTVSRIAGVKKHSKSKEFIFQISGVIEEADQGNRTFTLRRLPETRDSLFNDLNEITFSFEDNIYDDVIDAFTTLKRVTIAGFRTNSAHKALHIKPEESLNIN